MINEHDHDHDQDHDHDHEHSHTHGHTHNHDVSDVKGSRLIIVVVLNFIITIAQIIGGLYAGSLSLISDALHNFSDGIAIIISYLAIRIGQRENDEKRSFGYKRATILAAVLNAFFLIAISAFLFKEAYIKFLDPQPINGGVVIWVGLIGLVANFIGMLLLQQGAKGSLNIKASYLHLLTDTMSSIAVVIGGVLIYYYSVYWIDPILTVAIALYILKESYGIVKKAFHILMQGAPEDLELKEILADILLIDGVLGVHHVHVWNMDEHSIYFEAHVMIRDMLISEAAPVHDAIENKLAEYGIGHATIQFEFSGCSDQAVISPRN